MLVLVVSEVTKQHPLTVTASPSLWYEVGPLYVCLCVNLSPIEMRPAVNPVYHYHRYSTPVKSLGAEDKTLSVMGLCWAAMKVHSAVKYM